MGCGMGMALDRRESVLGDHDSVPYSFCVEGPAGIDLDMEKNAERWR